MGFVEIPPAAMKPGGDGGIKAVSYNFKYFPAPGVGRNDDRS